MPIVQRAAEFTVAGTYYWTVPNVITMVRLFLIGAGGGGGGGRTGLPGGLSGASGGGGGEMCLNQPMCVTPGDVVQVIVGAKGAGGLRGTNTGAPFASPGADGGATIVGRFRAAGGYGGQSGAGAGTNAGGDGGGVMGGAQRAGIAEPAGANGTTGRMNGIWTWNGGPSGGGYLHAPSNAGVGVGRTGGAAPGTGVTPASAFTANVSSGGPGAASVFGVGGAGGDGGTPPAIYNGQPAPAESWGAGGGGGGTDYLSTNHINQGNGAAGADGYALIMWMEIED